MVVDTDAPITDYTHFDIINEQKCGQNLWISAHQLSHSAVWGSRHHIDH